MIILIVGTNRPGSNTRKVAAHLEEIYAGLKVPLRVLDLARCLCRKAEIVPAVRGRGPAIRRAARRHARI
jgi:NAD(P)H-dependent FMN reductase